MRKKREVVARQEGEVVARQEGVYHQIRLCDERERDSFTLQQQVKQQVKHTSIYYCIRVSGGSRHVFYACPHTAISY